MLDVVRFVTATVLQIYRGIFERFFFENWLSFGTRYSHGIVVSLLWPTLYSDRKSSYLRSVVRRYPMLRRQMLSAGVCLSVCLSQAGVLSIRLHVQRHANDAVQWLSDSIFCCQRSRRNSTGSPPNIDAKYRGVGYNR